MESRSVPQAQTASLDDFHRQRRIEAQAKANRQQFYESDRVKTFHRKLLLTEALKGREEQIEKRRLMEIAAKDETKMFIAEIRQQKKEEVVKEWEKERQRERDRAAVFDNLRQQLQKQEEKMTEVEERKRWREAYDQVKAEFQRRKEDEVASVRRAHERFMAAQEAILARKAERVQMEEEWRSAAERGIEERVRKREEVEIERRRQVLRRRQDLTEKVAAQLREKAACHKEQHTGAAAQDVASDKDEKREQQEKAEKKKAERQAINAWREQKRREQAKREEVETLLANQEADRAHWDELQRETQKRREERSSMDSALRQQMAEKHARSQVWHSELLDYGKKNMQLLAEEEKQFQQHAAEVIDAAAKNKRNTFDLCKDASQVEVTGLGPITGGIRAGYLTSSDPSHAKLPDYISTTHEDIKKLYARPGVQNNMRLAYVR